MPRSKLVLMIEIHDSFIESGEEMKNVGQDVIMDLERALRPWKFDSISIKEVA